jgi:hypothetical protein
MFCQAVYAQQQRKHNPAQPRTHNFVFDQVYTVSAECHYNRLRVLDVRVSKEKLGYLKTGSFDRSTDLVTAQPFATVLSDYYTEMLSKSQPAGSGELVMVLYNIIVEDKAAAGQEIATMFLDADFFGSRGDRYYYLGTADTLYEMSSDGDVSEKLLQGTANKIAGIFSRFSGIQGKDGDKSYTAEELEGWRAADRQQYEAYKVAGNMKPGIYYTVEQFLNNMPVDTPIVIREVSSPADGKYTLVHYSKSMTNGRPTPVCAEDVFAVYDGKRLVCSHKRGFTKLRYENGEFVTVQYFNGIAGKRPSNAAMAGARYGILGAVMTYAIESAFPEKEKTANLPYHSRLSPADKRFIPLQRVR